LTSDDAIERLFRGSLVPLAAGGSTAGLRFAAAVVDDSHLVVARRPRLTAAELERGASAGGLDELRLLWAGSPELLALLPQLAEVQRLLAAERAMDAAPDRPSTLVYPLW
jgi:hypothetical protein